jgi:hypothetical protein
MNNDGPTKEELGREHQRVLNTLTDEAQQVATRKVTELGFDPNRGQVSLEETLINLAQARDILLDALDKRKLAQLPLKVQHTLYEQTQAVARELTSLMSGTDAVKNLDEAVEDLTASVWQFQLHNLSDQVLGFHSKMNQLKAQETAIRQGAKAAERLEQMRERTETTVAAIVATVDAIETDRATATKFLGEIETTAKESADAGQRISSVAATVAQHETTAAQQLANAKQWAADTEVIATKAAEMRQEIDTARTTLSELTAKTTTLLATTEQTAATQQTSFEAKYSELKETTEKGTTALTTKLDESITQVTTEAASQISAVKDAADARIGQLINTTTQRITDDQTKHGDALTKALAGFADKEDATFHAFDERAEASHKERQAQYRQLVDELATLETQIKDAIERATGYTLFHAFQRRQQDIQKAKNFWAWALAGCVVVSVGLAVWFVERVLPGIAVYDAAFYLKLSFSLPLIYAIAFCNLQYSRERKLEEEYAFKSSVSISLDPYQKLVANLVDKTSTAELAKYTEFIIQSVNRVFTSPTGAVFDGTTSDKNSAEKIIKAMGDFAEPLVRGLTKR